MGFGNLGWAEILVIAVFVLIFFGPQRMPEIARSMGHAMREFRRSLNQIQRELEEADPRTHIKRSIYGEEVTKSRPSEQTGERPAQPTSAPPPAPPAESDSPDAPDSPPADSDSPETPDSPDAPEPPSTSAP
jgi:Tat protein translocase TatB subunit